MTPGSFLLPATYTSPLNMVLLFVGLDTEFRWWKPMMFYGFTTFLLVLLLVEGRVVLEEEEEEACLVLYRLM